MQPCLFFGIVHNVMLLSGGSFGNFAKAVRPLPTQFATSPTLQPEHNGWGMGVEDGQSLERLLVNEWPYQSW